MLFARARHVRKPFQNWALMALAMALLGAAHASADSPFVERIEVAPVATRTWAEIEALPVVEPKSEEKSTIHGPQPGPAPRDLGVPGSPPPAGMDDPIPTPRGAVCNGLTDVAVDEAFLGLGDNNTSIPPDTMGAVGPDHLIVMLNTQVRIQSRDGGVVSTVSLDQFWAPANTLGNFNTFDPRIIYDPLAEKFIATVDVDARSATSRIFVAVSQTSDPTGTWDFFEFDADPANTTWADFPDIGFNKNWIVITNNMFEVAGSSSFVGAKMWALTKSTLGSGSVTVTIFNPGFDTDPQFGTFGLAIRVASSYDPMEETLFLTSGGAFTSGGTALLRVSQLTGPDTAPVWSVAPGSSFAGTGLFFVDNNFAFGLLDAAQAGTSTRVETNDARLLDAVFRNGRVFAANHGGLPVSGANRTAVFWYEFDPSALPNPITQSGVIDGGSDVHHFFPSISANCNGDVALGFSRSDPSRFVEAVATGRLAGDPAGTVRPIEVVKIGEDSYVKDFGGGRVRWGDYSATQVDPLDDSGFWTLQQYAETDVGPGANDDRWGTQWARIAAPAIVTCSGDVNVDGVVDSLDLADLLGTWGTSNPATDLDGDGTVGSTDLALLLGDWGPCP